MVYPNTNAMFGIEDVRAHDPMANGRYMGFLRPHRGLQIGTGELSPLVRERERVGARLSSTCVTCCRTRTTRCRTPSTGSSIHDGHRRQDLREPALPAAVLRRAQRGHRVPRREFIRQLREHERLGEHRAARRAEARDRSRSTTTSSTRAPTNAPLAVAQISSAEPTSYRMHVSAPRWSLVVSSIPWWPGWKVVRNGEARRSRSASTAPSSASPCRPARRTCGCTTRHGRGGWGVLAWRRWRWLVLGECRWRGRARSRDVTRRARIHRVLCASDVRVIRHGEAARIATAAGEVRHEAREAPRHPRTRDERR